MTVAFDHAAGDEHGVDQARVAGADDRAAQLRQTAKPQDSPVKSGR
ncbi:hypothetical protein ACQPXB_20190 [Amycolatopsis sp. CA-161197]